MRMTALLRIGTIAATAALLLLACVAVAGPLIWMEG